MIKMIAFASRCTDKLRWFTVIFSLLGYEQYDYYNRHGYYDRQGYYDKYYKYDQRYYDDYYGRGNYEDRYEVHLIPYLLQQSELI